MGRGSNRASASAEERPRWGLSVPACVSGRCAARASLVTRSKKKDATKVASFLFGPADRGSNRASALSFFRRAPGCACRGQCRAQLFATKERYRCGLPLAGTHRPASAILHRAIVFECRGGRLCPPAKGPLCVRRSLLHSVSAGAAKTPYPQPPSSFPNRNHFIGFRFG